MPIHCPLRRSATRQMPYNARVAIVTRIGPNNEFYVSPYVFILWPHRKRLFLRYATNGIPWSLQNALICALVNSNSRIQPRNTSRLNGAHMPLPMKHLWYALTYRDTSPIVANVVSFFIIIPHYVHYVHCVG